MESVGAWRPPVFSHLQESWSKVNHAARDLATVFSEPFVLVTIAVQLVKTPLSRCLGPSLIMGSFAYSGIKASCEPLFS